MSEQKVQEAQEAQEEPKLTAAELTAKYKKQRLHSIIIICIALIALIFACVAWFMNNQKVNSNTSGLSSSGLDFDIGVKQEDGQKAGVYDESLFGLHTSTKTFVCETGENAGTYLLSDSPDLTSLLVSKSDNMNNYEDNGTIMPGASGQITFYLIPRIDGLSEVKLELNTKAYSLIDEKKSASSDNIQEITSESANSIVLDYLSRHILFFRDKNSQGYYSGWIKDKTIIVSASSYNNGESTFTKDTPYKITIYWEWVEQFRNMVYTNVTNKLFQDTTSADYIALLNDINTPENRSKYFDFPSGTEVNEGASNEMSQAAYDLYSEAYNQADQKIGYQIRYMKSSFSIKKAD